MSASESQSLKSYSLSDIEKILPPLPERRKRQPENVRHDTTGATVDRLEAMTRFKKYLDLVDDDKIQHANRDPDTYRLAAMGLRDFGLNADDVFSLIWPWIEQRCKPAWSEDELRTKWDWVTRLWASRKENK